MTSPELSRRGVVYEDRYQRIYRVTADFGDFEKEYFVRESGQRAGVVVIQSESLLLVRQYRLLINGLSWEIPGGSVDEGETPEAAAARECFEETGVVCTNLSPLLSYQAGLDTFHNPTHLFHTDQFVIQGGHYSDPAEVHEHLWVPVGRCIEMVREGDIVDSFSILAVLSYRMQTGKL